MLTLHAVPPRAQARIHELTHARAHTRAHAHTHTHTHTQEHSIEHYRQEFVQFDKNQDTFLDEAELTELASVFVPVCVYMCICVFQRRCKDSINPKP